MRKWKEFLEQRRNEWADTFRVHSLLSSSLRGWSRAVTIIKYQRATKLRAEAQLSLFLRRKALWVFYLFVFEILV